MLNDVVILFWVDLDAAAHPRTRHDIIQWTYFSNTHIYADNDPDNYHRLEGMYCHAFVFLLIDKQYQYNII